MKHIVLFASGSGTNVENIARYFEGHPEIKISCVLTDRKDAYVLERCNTLGIPGFYFNRHSFKGGGHVLKLLKSIQPDLIVLAGFLRLIPAEMVQAFPKKIINIHPALLPKYGGKGMYGHHVHEAVKAKGEKESGITIHYVNERYDEGAIITQEKTRLEPGDSAEEIGRKVQLLEHRHFPLVIEDLLTRN
ncbi:phosphoribosylglycinamide formyltransferase [Muriicola marianensis]|uniref:Phosphoribosylglycinamide formyltransferase n=1 Tax=Muriicola marianensis TaxID=1324801 RepID=A0ABQ1QXU2_9FLAO|nr:phosphoribosylglycinamide formyltransferase [Muriicola marianensis]GGD51159.1 phosphoribosylglycinamide formyltransferase [Muriicola marianensis]